MWQPIETAPRDGTIVLLWDGRKITTASYDPDYGGSWDLVVCGDYAESSEFYGATHWHTLPAPPNAQTPDP